MSTKLFFAAANSMHINRDTFGRWDWAAQPLNILVAFEPKEGFRSWQKRGETEEYHQAYETPGVKTILDSGAFSAWKSGTPVDLQELIEEAQKPEWDECAALDVIGDPEASRDNAWEMVNRGIPTIPVFHYGEPWEFLTEYKAKPEFKGRIGLGGIATGIGTTEKRRWLDQCFARAYPARFHGFGVASREILMAYPFATVDTASWHTGLRYGRSAAFGDIKMPRKSELDGGEFEDSAYDLRFEIKKYLEMETEVQQRWKSELAWTQKP